MPWIRLPSGQEAWVPDEVWANPQHQQAIAAQGGVVSGREGTKKVGSNPLSTGPANLPFTNVVDQARGVIGGAVTAGKDARSQEAAAAQGAATATPAPVDTSAADAERVRQNTMRSLMLLRQNVGGQQASSIAALRRALAGRGMLDSGSLGAGVTNIGNQGADILARGTQHATMGENDAINRLMAENRARQYDWLKFDTERKDRLARDDFERRNEHRRSMSGGPSFSSGFDNFLALVGAAAPAAGSYFGAKGKS